MDLGIRGRTAIVCGASKGLGRACAQALAREGVVVVISARTAAPLEEAAHAINEETGSRAIPVVADVGTAAGRRALLSACPDPDILINNAGGPPAGDFHDWERETWLRALDVNMLAPIELIKATIKGMQTRKFGRIVNITSSAVRSPLPHLGLSNGARAGLTGFVAGLSRQVARDNVTINNLLPGSFSTDRLSDAVASAAAKSGVTVAQEVERRCADVPAGRFGDPAEFGAFCAFLCAATSGYIVGQNFLSDGGAVRLTL